MNIKLLILNILIPNIFGLIGNLLGNSSNGFDQIIQPPFTPPAIVFPIVWIILYTLMGISSYLIYTSNNPNKNKALLFYEIQLVLNTLWTFFFFRLNWFLFSFFWIILILIFVILMIYEFNKINKTAALLQIPYVLWLLFASILNLRYLSSKLTFRVYLTFYSLNKL
ncbi:MAG: tryptophan-rich sensory protein [Clostridiales bacterium]|nr:tryptophan-rich sensory protein [Clostridiales bacterium]